MSKIILIDSNVVCNVMSIYTDHQGLWKKMDNIDNILKKFQRKVYGTGDIAKKYTCEKIKNQSNKVIIFKMAKLIMDKSLLLTTNTKCNTDNLLNNMFAFYIAIIIARSGFSITKSIHWYFWKKTLMVIRNNIHIVIKFVDIMLAIFLFSLNYRIQNMICFNLIF